MKELTIQNLKNHILKTTSKDGIKIYTTSEKFKKDYKAIQAIQKECNELNEYWFINVIAVIHGSGLKVNDLKVSYKDGYSAGSYFSLDDGRIAICQGFSTGQYGFNSNWFKVVNDKESTYKKAPLNYIVNSYRSSKPVMKNVLMNYETINIIIQG